MKKKADAKKIATWIIVPLMIAIFALDIVTVALGNHYAKRYTIEKETYTYKYGNDRIHFLSSGASDAILLESNGMFALIDSGEGNNNPRRSTSYEGYEEEVVEYLKKVAVNESGKVELAFIIGTHCHYDHIGAFGAIINDTDIIINKAYFKEFDPEIAKDYEIDSWHIDTVYGDIISALNEKNVSVISDVPDTLQLGDFALELYNTVNSPELYGEGENAASIGVKVTKGEKSAFLASDFTKSCGLEQLYGEEIGEIDLLKAGHHGYFGSSSQKFLEQLSPELIIVTNRLGKVYPNVKWNFTMSAKVPYYATYDNNGIIASFTDDNKIVLTNNIH